MSPDFRKLLSARFFFTFAVQMQSVVLGWRIYELLKDPLALGMIGLTEAVPAIGLSLFAGYIVDRSRALVVYRRVIYISLLSGVLVLSEHLLEHNLSIAGQAAMLYAAAFLTGLARSFAGPAVYSATPRLVTKETLLRATATMNSALQIARISGPALGGLIFGFAGAVATSTLVCMLLAVAMWSMLRIHIVLDPLPPSVKHKSVKDEFLSGLRFVFGHGVLFPALTLDMVSVMFGGVTALLPIFASDILQVGPKGLGILRASPAIGAALMGIYQSRRSLKGNSGTWLLGAITGFGVCILVFGLSTNFYLSCTALFLSGAFDSINMIIRSSAVQMLSPDHMRGKISAVNSIFIGSSNEIGELESGIAAKLLGTVPAVMFGGVMCLLTVATVGFFAPKLRKLDLQNLPPV